MEELSEAVGLSRRRDRADHEDLEASRSASIRPSARARTAASATSSKTATSTRPTDSAMQQMLKDKINHVLKSLTYREREIIRLRYGLGDGYSYTLEETGRIFKVTRERIRQIESKALKKLQHHTRSDHLQGLRRRPAPQDTRRRRSAALPRSHARRRRSQLAAITVTRETGSRDDLRRFFHRRQSALIAGTRAIILVQRPS